MADHLPFCPEIPEKLRDAARRGKLVPFVGAGVSQLAGCPGWSAFSAGVLNYFVTQGKIGHGLFAQLSGLQNRVRLSIAKQLEEQHSISIDYNELLSPKPFLRPVGERIYADLLSLGRKLVVTTNYDDWLDRDYGQERTQTAVPSTEAVASLPRRKKVIIDRSDITVACLNNPENTVIHIHGSVKKPNTMVLTTRDYLKLYASHRASTEPNDERENPYLTFLERLFQEWTVLFVGYGLAELEILEYVLQKSRAHGTLEPHHFILQGFFEHESPLADLLCQSYRKEFGVQLLPFSREGKDWEQLADVIEYYRKELEIGDSPALERREDMEGLLSNHTNSTEEEFVQRMAMDPELEQWGFQKLSLCQPHERWFHLLRTHGLFDPSRNPKPVPGRHAGHLRIPEWPALDFLSTYMKAHPTLSGEILEIIRKVSLYKFPDGSSNDNYLTFRKFAEILGNTPVDLIQDEHLDLIPLWLENVFDQEEVTHAIDTGLLTNLLSGNDSENWRKAIILLEHCTRVQQLSEFASNSRGRRFRIACGESALRDLLRNQSEQLGTKTGKAAVEILLNSIRVVFDTDMTWSMRPAVEDHVQNHSWATAGDVLVEGVRDVLIAWAKSDTTSLKPYVRQLLADESEIVRRIAIYIMNKCRKELGEVPVEILPKLVADFDHLHELYGMLLEHYKSYKPDLKEAVCQAIRNIPQPNSADGDLYLRRIQQTWLSAMVNKGESDIDQWYAEISSTPGLGALSEYPDFFTWHEIHVGPGPSPFSREQLIEFARRGNLVDELDAFEEQPDWREPTVEALVNVLENAVNTQMEVFVPIVPDFAKAKSAYQYGLINGFYKAWESKQNEGGAWGGIWQALISLFEGILRSPNLWDEPSSDHRPLRPIARWLPSLIAEFIRRGMQPTEQTSCPEALLPRIWKIIVELLSRAKPMELLGDDPQNRASNSERGKVLEALFGYALRLARDSDAGPACHADAWKKVEPTFNDELGKCKNENFEFSVLAAEYIAQLHYLAPDWLGANLIQIFPDDHPRNFECAVSGLAYATITLPIYRLLVANDVFIRAVRTEQLNDQARDKLLEWLALGYIWGEEHFIKQALPTIFEARRIRDFRNLCHYFWQIQRNDRLSKEQVDRVLAFWEQCVDWADSQSDRQETLGVFGRLAIYASSDFERSFRLLRAIAPFVNLDHDDMFFVDELGRLVDRYPKEILEVLTVFLRDYAPSMDYKGQFKALLTKLMSLLPEKKDELIGIINKLRALPGMPELYKEIKGTN